MSTSSPARPEAGATAARVHRSRLRLAAISIVAGVVGVSAAPAAADETA